jgi:hypothetical protein
MDGCFFLIMMMMMMTMMSRRDDISHRKNWIFFGGGNHPKLKDREVGGRSSSRPDKHIPTNHHPTPSSRYVCIYVPPIQVQFLGTSTRPFVSPARTYRPHL